jgi:hypothetical protein
LKEVPRTPQELLKEEKGALAQATSSILVRERTSLFRSDFAAGEIGYREKRGLSSLTLGINLLRRFTPSPSPSSPQS